MDDRESLRSSVADVLAEICDRRAVHRHVDGKEDLAKTLRERAGVLGWLAIGISPASGGLGLGADGLALLSQELGRLLAPGPFIPTLIAAQIIDEFAPVSVREMLLPDLLSGRRSAATPARLPTSEGDKEGILLGDPTSLDLVLLAGENPGAGLRIMSSAQSNASLREGWDATRPMCAIPDQLEAVCDLPREASERLFVLANLLVAADSLGLMQGVFAQTVDYLKTREQFGVTIGSFQALKHRAADLAAMIELNECLLEQAIESAGSGAPHSALWSATCKAAVTDAAVFLNQECLQLHGGIGFTWEYDCHLFLKRARLDQVLVDDNTALRTRAFDLFAEAADRGLSPMEIAQ